jgi:uncharacterized protein
VGNAVVHFGVGAADDGPLVTFYGELFGWSLHGVPGYTAIDTRGSDGINGGISKSLTGAPWSTFYVGTDDLQATLDRASSLGGSTVLPATRLGEAAAIALFSDPDGLLVGLVQASAESVPSAGPGEPVTWFEVVGSDAARTQRFYADLFGWTVDSSGFPGYAVVDPLSGRGIQGGIGGGEDICWATVYARVADVDQTLNRAEELGGSRISAPGLIALKSAARAALYGSADDGMKTGAFRDPAGNIFGVFDYGTG